jgi:hypothetical protein
LTGETKHAKGGTKKLGRAITKSEELRDAIWRGHLRGEGIGVVPIRDDNSCVFGAIDIDAYEGLDFRKIQEGIDKQYMPLTICKSKSGGAHLYLFTSEPIPAALMRRKLQTMACALAVADSEIFPKQETILADRGDVGGWINLPYCGNTRPALDPATLRPLTIEAFLDLAETRMVSERELEAYTTKVGNEATDGPPCIQHIISVGAPEGCRNDALFGVGVYLKKKHGEGGDWSTALMEFNQQHMTPPLSFDEVTRVAQSLDKKDYGYTCDRPPLKLFCDKGTCRTRKYGVGRDAEVPELRGLTMYKTVPPIWFVSVDDEKGKEQRVELSTPELQSPHLFQCKCLESGILVPKANQKDWFVALKEGMRTMRVYDVEFEAQPQGVFRELLEIFVTSRAKGRSDEELLLGKAWTDDHYTYFRHRSLLSFLDKEKFNNLKDNAITTILRRDLNAALVRYTIAGRNGQPGHRVSCWKVPRANISTVDLAIEVEPPTVESPDIL